MTPPAEVIGVILAAGKGTRIQPLSELTPKPILPVCNRPLLDCQLEMMKACGISEVLIVIGNLGYAIVNALGDGSHRDMKITYVEQTETLGMAHALGRLETLIASPISRSAARRRSIRGLGSSTATCVAVRTCTGRSTALIASSTSPPGSRSGPATRSSMTTWTPTSWGP